MTTEPENKEQEPTEATPTEGEPAPLAEKMMPVSAHQIQVDKAVKAAVAEALAKQTAEAEEAKLAEANEFKALYEKEKAARLETEQASQAQAKRLTIEAKLAGVTVSDQPEVNQAMIQSLVNECPDDVQPDDYVATLQKEKPWLFKTPPAPCAQPAQGGRAAGGSTKSLEERAAGGDKAAMAEYFNTLNRQ
jgi:hypothetical protein